MTIRRALAGFIVGLLFGLGLAISQMTNPQKVLSFLTLGPGWDPSLVLVMGGAVAVTFFGYRWASQGQPLFDDHFHHPASRQLDGRLLAGAGLFGLGWGMAGYCPGPVIAGLASGSVEPWVFLLAMLAGSQLAKWLPTKPADSAPAPHA